ALCGQVGYVSCERGCEAARLQVQIEASITRGKMSDAASIAFNRNRSHFDDPIEFATIDGFRYPRENVRLKFRSASIAFDRNRSHFDDPIDFATIDRFR
ncbi:hypothetical protein HaLaN_09794, partial [Haematococcus lacustris]